MSGGGKFSNVDYGTSVGNSPCYRCSRLTSLKGFRPLDWLCAGGTGPSEGIGLFGVRGRETLGEGSGCAPSGSFNSRDSRELN
jgi:hypothetical protein